MLVVLGVIAVLWVGTALAMAEVHKNVRPVFIVLSSVITVGLAYAWYSFNHSETEEREDRNDVEGARRALLNQNIHGVQVLDWSPGQVELARVQDAASQQIDEKIHEVMLQQKKIQDEIQHSQQYGMKELENERHRHKEYQQQLKQLQDTQQQVKQLQDKLNAIQRERSITTQQPRRELQIVHPVPVPEQRSEPRVISVITPNAAGQILEQAGRAAGAAVGVGRNAMEAGRNVMEAGVAAITTTQSVKLKFQADKDGRLRLYKRQGNRWIPDDKKYNVGERITAFDQNENTCYYVLHKTNRGNLEWQERY